MSSPPLDHQEQAQHSAEWPTTSSYGFGPHSYSAGGAGGRPSLAHPDLPSEPPDYDEFEFSFPAGLSPPMFSGMLGGETPPSLRGLGFGGGGSFSPIPSLSALSSAGGSPAQWHTTMEREQQEKLLAMRQQLQEQEDAKSERRQSTGEEAGASSKDHDLLGDNEKSALEAFFSEQLSPAAASAREAAAQDSHPSPAQQNGNKRGMPSDFTPTARAPSPGPAPAPVRALSKVRGRAKAKTLDMQESSTDERPSSANDSKRQDKRAEVLTSRSESQSSSKKPRLSVTTTRKPSTTPSATTKLSTSSQAATAAAPSGTGKRVTHVASEQRRRMTIKDNYKALVDLLLAGEESSGISLLNAANEDEENEGGGAAAGSGTKKGKPKGRGRGRKGQDGAGATKSTVLERAAEYLKWLEKGNAEIEREIARAEDLLEG